MAGRVHGKVAFITGAGRGQGRSHALRLAEEGAVIIATDICADIATSAIPLATRADLDETAHLVEKVGGTVLQAIVDVRDPDGLSDVLDQAVRRFGKLDIVVANAGLESFGQSHELPGAAWDDSIAVNLTGVWNTCSAATPHLIENPDGGSIIINSSSNGVRARANSVHYNSAKFGVVGLMRTLAIELGPHRIRVNTVHPGGVDTKMLDNDAVFRLFAPEIPEPTADDVRPRLAALNLLPTTYIEPIDISHAVLFLASDEARFITGVSLPVDAGSVLK